MLITATLFFSSISGAKAQSNLERVRQCNEPTSNSDPVYPDNLDYSVLDGGDDFQFDYANPYCMAVVLPPYISLKIAIAAMNANCSANRSQARIGRPYPTPLNDARDITRGTARCALTKNVACCATVAFASASFSSFLIGMRIQYDYAKEAYNNTALCGGGLDEDWVRWNKVSKLRDIDQRKKVVRDTIETWTANCNSNSNSGDCIKLQNGLRDQQIYREWYYGGVERQDTGDDACPDVTRAVDVTSQEKVVTYTDTDNTTQRFPAQRYYMRGTSAGNFACGRFDYRMANGDPLSSDHGPLSPERIKQYKYAHSCCIEKSKTTICVERKYCSTGLQTHPTQNNVHCPDSNNIITDHKFCKVGTDCYLGNSVNYVIFESTVEDNNRLICAKSKNLCPYNFNVGGGTQTCDYYKDGVKSSGSEFITPISLDDIKDKDCDGKSEIRNDNCTFNANAGKCKNYCQYLNHCTVISGNQDNYNTSITSPYFSNACLDFVGDSKNEYGFGKTADGEISITGVQKHFTAPVAQCIRETLENIFYNRAGHSQCRYDSEYPNRNGDCFSGEYIYKKGQLLDTQSFFADIQQKLTTAIKLALTIAIIMYGFKILVAAPEVGLKSSDLKMFVGKMALVLFFATGTAWQGFFFNGVYNASATFSTIVMNIRTSNNPIQRDGCQFGKVSFANGGTGTVSSGDYPTGKEYLAVFDTLDCKIARYLGYGPSASVATIAMLILPAMLSPTLGAIGIFFAIFTLMFGILMIIAAIRTLHIFLTSAFAIILLVYVSPITITCVLFQKTKSMFDSWLNNLIGYSLQPIILFAYIGLFITIFETLVTGSATFSGNAPTKEIVCNKVCLKNDGTSQIMTGTPAQQNEGCDIENGEKLLDPKSDSVACILNFSSNDLNTIPVLEPIGIIIPILEDFFGNGIQKILTMLKALLVIFILVGFIDDIPGIASNWMGGESLPTYKMDPMSMAKRMAGIATAIQIRAARGMAKLGKAGRDAAGSGAKSAARGAASAREAIGKKFGVGGGEAKSENKGSSDTGGSAKRRTPWRPGNDDGSA